MKILVLGGTGMAGHVISIFLKEKGYDVTALTRKQVSYVDHVIGDVEDLDFLKKLLSQESYDYIINAVGILNQSAEVNKSRAVYLNSYLPHFLCDFTREMKTRVIHMSTDCVFSGKTGNYSEGSFKDGESFYDRSKALGEVDDCKNLTFRNSIVGPDLNEKGIGLFNWFMRQKDPINGYTKAIWTGVTTITLAKAMEAAMRSNLSGLYNLVNNEVISKYTLLQLFNICLKDNLVTINAFDDYVLDKSLINNRRDFSFEVPPYEEMIREMKEWIYNHKDLYPHYFEKENV